METVSREQYKELRKRGYTQEQITDLAKRDRLSETLDDNSFAKKGLLRSAGEFLGMEEFGRGIGTTISNTLGTQDRLIQATDQSTDIQTNLLRRIKQKEARGEDTTRLKEALSKLSSATTASASQATNIGTSGLSSREVVGSAAQTGLSVIGLRGGLPTARTLGMGARPILGGAAAGALSGAAFGASEAVTEGKNVLKGAAIGGAIGAPLGAATGALSKYIDDLAGKTPEKQIGSMKDSLKTLKTAFEKNSRYRVVDGEKVYYQNPITTLAESKAVPKVIDGKVDATDAKAALNRLITELDDESLSLVDEAAANGTAITIKDFRKAVETAISQSDDLKASGAVMKTLRSAGQIFDDYEVSYGQQIPIDRLNAIRIAMNRVYDPAEKDAARTVGDAAREFIYTNAPGSQAALAREGELLAALKFLERMDGLAVKGGRLGRYFADLVGAIAGSSTQVPVVGPIVGAMGARTIANQMQQNYFKPLSGQVARTLTAVFDRLPTDEAGNVSKTAILNAIAQLSNQ
jgi:hypothetical protein